MSLELNSHCLEGLSAFPSLSSSAQSHLFKDSLSSALHGSNESTHASEYDTNVTYQQVLQSILTLVLEATKQDAAKHELQTLLEDSQWSDSQISSFLSFYDANKSILRSTAPTSSASSSSSSTAASNVSSISSWLSSLASTSTTFSRIYDLTWRIDDHINSSSMNHIRAPIYILQLHILNEKNEKNILSFTANYQELQDLLAKIKDAIKQTQQQLE